jgi:hypothetical protein
MPSRDNKTYATILGLVLTILMGLSGWTISTVHNLSLDLSSLRQLVIDSKEARLAYQKSDEQDKKSAETTNTEAHNKILTTLGTLISRPEFEARLAELTTEIKQLNVNLAELRLRVAAIELKISPAK